MSAENRLETVIALLRSHLNKNLKEIGLLLGNAKISPNYELVEEQYLGLPLWWAGDVIERKRNFVFFQFFSVFEAFSLKSLQSTQYSSHMYTYIVVHYHYLLT